MRKSRCFLNATFLLFLWVSFSLSACGGTQARPVPSSTRTAVRTGRPSLDTGPLGLPLYCVDSYLQVDQADNLYISDSDQGDKGSHRARIVKLSPTGQLLTEWHVFTSFHGSPSGPFGLAIDPQGITYVGDAGDNTIKKLSPTGQVLAVWGKKGSASGELNWPQGIAMDAQGNIFVADFNNARVLKLSPTGALLAIWGTTGGPLQRLKSPVGMSFDAQGDLYVADVRAHRIVKFSSHGTFLEAWDRAESKVFSSAKDVAVDRLGGTS